LNNNIKIPSLLFFLSAILLFQTVTFTPIASAQIYNEDTNIPSWFKNNVKWWNEGKLSDKEITNTIKNLLKREIIKLDSTKIQTGTTIPESKLFLPPNKDGAAIPSYVKNTLVSWQEGLVSDSDVGNTIKFLIEADHTISPTSSLDKSRQKAAIIDQLSDLVPNKPHQLKALEYLESAGYNVDVYTTEDITVDFFKKLPSMNYKFIYIRTHSLEIPQLEDATFLFTGEKYDVNKYISEQLSGQVRKAIPINDQLPEELITNATAYEESMYFTIGPKFVDELMVGEFPQTVIVIAGCESVRSQDMAASLIYRGASSVVGWDRSIQSFENDRVMLGLLEGILIDKVGINDGIKSAMQNFGTDLEWDSKLHQIIPER
jgi:hypothetical protein